jgi:hypothetical protein
MTDTAGGTTVQDFEVQAFFPADHAVTAQGKLYVNGGFWDQLRFPGYPATLPQVSLVAVVRVPFHRYHADHKMSFALEDADGQPLPARVDGEFRVGAAPELHFGDPTLMQLAVQIASLEIPSPGAYVFTFAIDGEPMARYSFQARLIAMPMTFNLAEAPPTDEPGGD